MSTDATGELDELLELARRAAVGAGELLAAYSTEQSARALLRSQAQPKSSSTDWATEADLASEAFIVKEILAARPADGVLGEEGAARTGTSGLRWVIDPLDGTTNFAYGYSSYAVSVAAERDGVALVGVVYDPTRHQLFAAGQGRGASYNNEPIARRLAVPELGQSLVGTGFGYRAALRAEQAKLLLRLLPAVRDIRRGGAAALDLCDLALGRLDLYYEAGLKPWDRAAGLLICSEVGLSHRDLPDLVAGADTLVVGPTASFAAFVELLQDAAKPA